VSHQRYATSLSTLIIDKAMTWFIKLGGITVIIAVFCIFVFILWQVLPLFRSAQVTALPTHDLPASTQLKEIVGLLSDEWGEMPLMVQRDGTAQFLSLPADESVSATNSSSSTVPVRSVNLGLGENVRITSFIADPRNYRVTIGTSDGKLAVRSVSYSLNFAPTSNAANNSSVRSIQGSIRSDLTLNLGSEGQPIISASYGDSGGQKLAGIIQQDGEKRKVIVASLKQTRSLMGAGKVEQDKVYDLTDKISEKPEKIIVDDKAESAVVVTESGHILYFFLLDGEFTLRQSFLPFGDQPVKHIASIDYLLGDVSLVLTNDSGLNRIFSLHIKTNESIRTFGLTKEFSENLSGGAQQFVRSVRNKSFLLTHNSTASLRHGTSSAIRWEAQLPFPIVAATMSAKYHRMIFIGEDKKVHPYLLDDPHPESGMRALFGKVWYEGSDAPKYDWQSTGSTDDFEPKLSMIPLLLGSLKGTIYALLFALPIALLGAVYTAEFMHPRLKKIIKPTVEIMASLPSVVLGFLAAIWLAPILEYKVPSFLLVFLALPSSALLFGWFWSSLPSSTRVYIRPGYEFIAFLPILIVVTFVAWNLGPAFERVFFSVNGVGDFPTWWRLTTGFSYEQRNSLVVGIMMGFAVIPIIFTIAEDALSNVPPALRSGALALGASRWQTAMNIVLPTASAGIFSAVMIGFGRAIGETMIVVMATGNTPIMGMNIFDGMRTLSANIAVEIPEAPLHGTLYRTLFLGALLLFLLTFVINTIAEVLRQHLREKYKTV
jgi:phosphate transport system permease protein